MARPELAEAHGADERDDSPDPPDRERPQGGARPLGHDGRIQEDAGADDSADDQHRPVEQSEASRVFDFHPAHLIRSRKR